MTTPRPSGTNPSMQQMIDWLQHIQQQAELTFGDDAVHIHQKPITYVDNDQRGQWNIDDFEEESELRHTIQKLEKEGTGKASTWIAYCNGPNEGYPGRKLPAAAKNLPQGHPNRPNQWNLVGRHAFIFVLTKQSTGGKNLYIFDNEQGLSEAEREKGVKGFNCQLARQFMIRMRGGMKMKINGVFVGNRGQLYMGQNRCQDEATRFLEEIASKSGKQVDHEDDNRFDGFVEFDMKGSNESGK